MRPADSRSPATHTNGGLSRSGPADAEPGRLPAICFELQHRVQQFLNADGEGDKALRSVQEQAKLSMDIIKDALVRYRFEELSLSYNGGKDCLVLLVLLLACLPATLSSPTDSDAARPPVPSTLSASSPCRLLQGVYIAPQDPFAEVEDFVTTSCQHYNLDLSRSALPMRAALDAYKSQKPGVRAIFLGTRRTDPYSEFMTPFSPTDSDWPEFMRVNPILDWSYANIWTFIRRLEVPYCALYDQGYTSLGGTTNTLPNPKLALDTDGTAFRPAYELLRDDEERLGRVRPKR